jgi:CheY-specific phosphatase CheX
MAKNIRLTPALLRKLVLQEKKKIQESLEKGEESVEDVHAVEVDAGDEADSLEKDIDWMAALKIQESILKKKYAKVQKAKKRLVKKITNR